MLASKKRDKADMSKFVGSYSTGNSIDVVEPDPEVIEDIRAVKQKEKTRKLRLNFVIFIIALALSIWIAIKLYPIIF